MPEQFSPFTSIFCRPEIRYTPSPLHYLQQRARAPLQVFLARPPEGEVGEKRTKMLCGKHSVGPFVSQAARPRSAERGPEPPPRRAGFGGPLQASGADGTRLCCDEFKGKPTDKPKKKKEKEKKMCRGRQGAMLDSNTK